MRATSSCPVGLVLPAADAADRLRWQVEKRRQPLDPLVEQLPPMDEHERVDAALGDEPGGDDRLAERRRRGQHAGVVRQHRFRGGLSAPARSSPSERHVQTVGRRSARRER